MDDVNSILAEIARFQATETDAVAGLVGLPAQFAAKVVSDNAKVVTKLQGKIIKRIAREGVVRSDATDALSTTVLSGLQQWLSQERSFVEQLAIKGGILQIGQPLEEALLSEATEAPQVAYLGTLVLAVKEAVPWLERIASALERIADSVHSPTVPVPGEPVEGADILSPLVLHWPDLLDPAAEDADTQP